MPVSKDILIKIGAEHPDLRDLIRPMLKQSATDSLSVINKIQQDLDARLQRFFSPRPINLTFQHKNTPNNPPEVIKLKVVVSGVLTREDVVYRESAKIRAQMVKMLLDQMLIKNGFSTPRKKNGETIFLSRDRKLSLSNYYWENMDICFDVQIEPW